MRDKTKVGTTYGLAHTSDDDNPEQVYVFADPDLSIRPIRIEGWKGYTIPNQMHLTRNQAEELRDLLTEALNRVPVKPEAYLVSVEAGERLINVDTKPMRFIRGQWVEISGADE